MKIPSMSEVENADKETLARLYRFGEIDYSANSDEIIRQTDVMNHVIARFQGMGGFDPELSKKVGWDE